MTKHVAFGKLRTALFALPYYTKQTVTHDLPLTSKLKNSNRQKKYTLDNNKFRNVIISGFLFANIECCTSSPLQS